MIVSEIRTFVPSKDFAISKQWYIDLGFKVTYEDKDLTQFGNASHGFFLQHAYVKDWADNLMLTCYVDDLDALHERATNLVKTHEGTRAGVIFDAHYGRTFHLIGPAGELWHMCYRDNTNKK